MGYNDITRQLLSSLWIMPNAFSCRRIVINLPLPRQVPYRITAWVACNFHIKGNLHFTPVLFICSIFAPSCEFYADRNEENSR